MLRSNRRFISLALGLVAATALISVADAGLYPRAAPPGSAFVRLFNATNNPHLTAKIGDKPIPDTPPLDASAYVFVNPGELPSTIGNTDQKVKLDANRCYTLAVTPAGVTKFEQDCFSSQLKSLLSVYNLIDGSHLSLRMADSGTKVIDGVSSGAAAHREVNPAKASLAVFDGDTKLADAKPVQLERGKVFSLFVTGTTEQPQLIWVVN
jgi:alginate O-acetyltransferase complex protein AlgF